MKRRILTILLTVLLVFGIAPLPGAVSAADAVMSTSIRNSSGYEFAIFPIKGDFHISQKWNDPYSHGNQLAMDFTTLTPEGWKRDKGQICAPFTGEIVESYSSWGCVVFQSNKPVQYADGTVDIMTVVFGHDNDSEMYTKKTTIKQGEVLCKTGTAWGYADHTHIFVIRGSWDEWVAGGYREAGQRYVNSGGGNVVPIDAFFLDEGFSDDWTRRPASCYYPKNTVTWTTLTSEKAMSYTCNHGYGDLGVCKHCGITYNWVDEVDYSFNGVYKTTKTINPSRSVPYDADPSEAAKVKKGTEVYVIARYKNAHENYWYQISLDNRSCYGYVYEGWVKYVRPLPSDIRINVTFPAEGQTIAKKTTNLTGNITSTVKIKSVEGYLDGKKVSTDYPNATYFDLVRSDFDYALPFNTMFSGRHTLKLVVTDVNGETKEYTRVFYTELSPCAAASLTTEDVWGGKVVTLSCAGANIRYTTDTGKSGSGTGSIQVPIEGTTTFTVTTSKSGYSENKIQRTVTVEQTMAPQFTTVERYDGVYVTITSNPNAQIYYYFDGTSHGEYCGTFRETEPRTVYAYAYSPGRTASETTQITIEETKPAKPTVMLLDTANKIAVGKTVVWSWNSDHRAEKYTVSLYRDGVLLDTIVQTENAFSYVLSEPGKYELSVKASNPIGSSETSGKVAVTAMAPSTVRFVDDDGSLLAEYVLDYGSYLQTQPEPSRKGHHFSGWSPANNYTANPVTEDATYVAMYTPIKYEVVFYDVDGAKFGSTQRIPYQQSATLPDYSDNVPAGYVFAGWTVIEASDTESMCDYTCVDADLKLQAVIRWAHEELPVHAEIKSAEMKSVEGESNYWVTVNLTNWPTSMSDVYVCVALKAEDPESGTYKTLYASKVDKKLAAGATASVTVELPYAGIAETTEVFILERKSDGTTGSAYSLSVSAPIVFEHSWTNWSGWSTNVPSSKDGRETETKTQYRYRTKETMTSSNSSVSGWELAGSSWAWSSYGSWSSWGNNYIASSESRQVETRNGYHYYYYVCSNCGTHMHGYGNCYTWAGGCGRNTIYSSSYSVIRSDIPYSSSYDFHGTGVRYVDSAEAGRAFAYTNPGSNYYVAPITQYRYRDRSKIWTYSLYRWSDWSAWTDESHTATSSKNVETRKIYRYRDEVLIYSEDAGAADTEGTVYSFNGSIGTDLDLSGKVATVMVYQSKNMDPNQYQTRYIGQTTILDGNRYDFSFITDKEPTVESGNYVVALGVQGTTGLLNVDVVEAPREIFTIRFLCEDGTILSEQRVTAGDNAHAPEIPEREGHRFVGWSEGFTDVYKNCDIYAQYERERYTVVFVDWVNSAIAFQECYYGDTIVSPYEPTAEGHSFVGWDAILDGNTTVTGNLAVSAVYDTATFTVKFYDEASQVIDTQTVAYGTAATLPADLEPEGRVFLGWSTETEWWNVKNDMDVYPIIVFQETAIVPMSNIDAVEHGTEVDLELYSEEGATIYYTLDGTVPTRESNIFSEPLHLTQTTPIMAMSCVEGKNDSECVYFLFVYDDTPNAVVPDTLLALDTTEISVEAGMNVPLQVSIADNPGLTGYTLIVECDLNVFYLDATGGEVCSSTELSESGEFVVQPYGNDGWRITWLSNTPCTGDGTLFTLPLKVDDSAREGTYEVKLSYAEGYIYSEDAEEIALPEKSVTIEGIDQEYLGYLEIGTVEVKDITVQIPISVRNVKGFSATTLALLFDRDLLRLDGMETADSFAGKLSFLSTDAGATLKWIGTQAVTEDDDFITLTFTILDNGENEWYPINLDVNSSSFTVSEDENTYIVLTEGGIEWVSSCAHVMEEMIIKTATCYADGVAQQTCSLCGYTKVEAIPMGHQYSEIILKEHDCLTGGHYVYTCIHCDDSYEKIIPPGHVWDAGVIVKEPTGCDIMNGEIRYTCTVCGESQMHFFGYEHEFVTDPAVAPTCTEPGLTEGSHCSLCNELVLAQETIPALGHNYTYTDNGENHTVGCESCDLAETAVHSYADGSCLCGAVEPTGIGGTCGENVTWSFVEATGCLTISGTGNMTDYTSSKLVPWYDYRNEIKFIQIENGITCVGDYVFRNLDSVTEVTLPNSITRIGVNAFSHCNILTTVNIGNNVREIGASAFQDCIKLLRVYYIGDKPSDIAENAFLNCSPSFEITHQPLPVGVDVKIGHALSLDSDLRVKYRVKYTDIAAAIPNYVTEGAYLVIEKDVYPANSEMRVDIFNLNADLTADPARMVFDLEGIQAAEMGSELRAVLHIFDAEGREYVSAVDVYSIRTYVESAMKNTSYETQPKMVTMLIDLLNYGAAAQVNFGRRTDELVNAGFEAYQQYATKELAAELTDVKETISNDRSITAVSKMGFSINLADRTEINAKMTMAAGYTMEDISKVEVRNAAGDVVDTITEFVLLVDDNNRVQLTFSGVRSVNMRDMFYFVAYVGDEMASDTFGYSIEASAKTTIANSTGSSADMILACMYYGDSAAAYFGK